MSSLQTLTANDEQTITEPRPRSGISGRPVRAAIVGTGFIADYHLEILRELEGVDVVAACDPAVSRLSAFCDRWSIAGRATSVESLLDDFQPDVVHVLVPPSLHAPITKQVLQGGAHALLEKPMALSAESALELRDLADRNGLHLGINHNWLYQPLFQRALTDIERRQIGPVRHVVSTNSLPLFQLEAGIHDHWMFAEPTNILFEQGPHPLSQICWLLGQVQHVEATWSDPRTLRGGKQFYTNWFFNLECERGTAQMSLSFGAHFPDARLHVIGQDGSIHIDQLNDLYALDSRTRLVPPVDCFVRGVRRSAATFAGALGGIVGYGASLFRLTGRKDVYYLGMKGSVDEFYRQVKAGTDSTLSSENGCQTICALDTVAQRFVDQVDSVQDEPEVAAPRPAVTKHEKVLVFGAGGFIGRHLIQTLAERGYPLRVMVRSPARIADLANRYELEIVQGDVEQAADVDRAVEGCDAVAHLVAGAPETWEGFQSLFVDSLKTVAAACLKHKVKRLLYASSIAALYLGDRRQVVTESTPPDARDQSRCDYAKAKILAERMLGELHEQENLPVVILRPGIVIGKGTAVQHLGVGEWPSPITCVRWGADVDAGMPLVLVDDVADAFANALEQPETDVIGKSFNLVGDVQLSARRYVDLLREVSGRNFQLHPQSTMAWSAIEWSKFLIKAVARKPENTRLTWRELAYRTGASKFNCAETKRLLAWRPEADEHAFIERGIRDALKAR